MAEPIGEPGCTLRAGCRWMPACFDGTCDEIPADDRSTTPGLGALLAAVEALPCTNADVFAWLHTHHLNVGAGAGVVLLAVRKDLRAAAGLGEVKS